LKHCTHGWTNSRLMGVAPRRGAWIETAAVLDMMHPSVTSHPAGVRGLKRGLALAFGHDCESHPAGVRGLKRYWGGV